MREGKKKRTATGEAKRKGGKNYAEEKSKNACLSKQLRNVRSQPEEDKG